MSNGFPSMTALLGLLAVAGYQNKDKIAEMLKGASDANPSGATSGQSGLGGILGNLGGAGAGGLVGGGLGQLIEHFRGNGHGEAADSWIRQGRNTEIPAEHMHSALGPDLLATLTKQTGLSSDELLSRLSRELPSAVDRYTPDGRLPAH
ncbi:YidB family protein [Methylobacterium sp. J-092]|uniref:YidB family protein n=1 Tax=Methylobacterium sp. J-092 TaxID=2836667 RepID=UPI001FBB8913|nr:YidB family protein [Methylobacterium sp. J-092]MCJ2006335.1 YidB family protein [Methylobacterium sp. J-092]